MQESLEDQREPWDLHAEAPKSTPLVALRRLLRLDFCAPNNPSNLHHANSTESSRDAPILTIGEFSKKERETGSVIMIHPFDTLKNALNQSSSEDTSLQANKVEDNSSEMMLQTLDSDESTKIARSFDEEDEQESEGESMLFITQPGTGRSVRVIRGLETFFVTIACLVITFRLLWSYRYDVGFSVEFVPKGIDRSFISLTSNFPELCPLTPSAPSTFVKDVLPSSRTSPVCTSTSRDSTHS